jgi:FADH2 O2-dependent halogenase
LAALRYDLAVFGSGFGGALLGMVARRLGLSVLLIERGTHPRFAIGESTSPLANLLIEELSERYRLPALRPLATFGAWQRAYPEIAVGLKRGFTYYAHRAGEPFRPCADHTTQLLVAASPNDATADTHWFRADVDHFLLRQALDTGVDYRDRTQVTGLERRADGWRITAEREGKLWSVEAGLLIDATGPRGLLHRLLELPESAFEGYPPTQTLYSHFTEVKRTDEMEAFRIPQEESTPPYRPDDSALHHVFDGGWMWVLRFNNGITSAGFAITDDLAHELDLRPSPSEGQPFSGAWSRFLARFPSIGEQFADARPVRPFVYSPRLSFRAGAVSGDGWALLPSAAAFVDPLFSTGIALTLLGIERLGRILADHFGRPTLNAALRDYAEITHQEADHTAAYIAACYRAMPDFTCFTPMTMFYFAAASYSEVARRLDRRHLITRYLAADLPTITDGIRRCNALLSRSSEHSAPTVQFDLEGEVCQAIEAINVAGLCDSGRRNWYPVDLQDLVRNAAKLEMTAEQMRQTLATAPWAHL